MKSFQIDDFNIAEYSYAIFIDNTHGSFMGITKGVRREQIKAALLAIRIHCTFAVKRTRPARISKR